MGKIIKLPDDVANRIAAGEVVERPASIVKELIENSLDADAGYIEIILEKGGKNLVLVTDDGEGMASNDIFLALERHATSKIADIDDLSAIMTLGFRGEALPSIASVSITEIVSRKNGDGMGFRVLVDHGEIIEQGDVSSRPGTTVSVRDLFAKVPVRRRFLKSDSSELARCNSTITQLAIANPDIAFRAEGDGNEMLYLTACLESRERISQLFGEDIIEKLREIQYESDDYSVFGFVGDRTLHRGRTSDEYFFLNNRPFRSRLITAALHKAFAGLLPPRRYPVAFIFIQAAPELVDVNVHPAKHEVRFRREESIFGAIYRAVHKVVGEQALPANSIKPLQLSSAPFAHQTRLDFPEPNRPKPGEKIPPRRIMQQEIAEILEKADTIPPEDKRNEPQAQFLQIMNTYIIVQTRESMLILDQHAAHERVLFEKVMKAVDSEGISGQRMLFPVEIKLPPQWTGILAGFLEKFSAIGFEIDIAKLDTARILSVPAFLHTGDYSALFREILDGLNEFSAGTPDAVKNFAASVACHAAIKAGQRLSQDEMATLFDSLFICDDPYHCPHGRPTIVKFSTEQLERMFGRR